MDANLLYQLEKDDTFKKFLEESFDVKNHANKTIQGRAISEQLSKLAEGISLLDKEIHSQIVSRHEDLLSQATGVETLEGVLQMMQTRIQSLLAAMDRVRAKVTEPFNKISTRTIQLHNLQEACDMLRRIIRILYLTKRLHSQLQGGAREITKAAQSLNELDYICEGMDLSGVDVIEQDRRFIKQARKEVETQAQKMLEQGMETQNQTQVATSLQVFHNLGSLGEIVNRVVTGCKTSLHKDIRSCLDMQALSQQQGTITSRGGGPGRAAMPVTGNTAQFRASLWTNMEKLMDSIYSTCAQVQHLQKVLVKKRDPVTHICFIEELGKQQDKPVNIMVEFWEDVTKMLTAEFREVAEASTFLKQAFESEYPKLLRLYNDLWRRLQQFSLSAGQTETSVSQAMTDSLFIPDEGIEGDFFVPDISSQYDSEKALRETISSFENAYLSKSLSRLFDPINLAFSTGSFSPPTPEEVDSIVKTISSELNVASIDPKLCITVSKNIAKTVKLFSVKSEQLLSTDGEASQVIGSPTQGQTRNAAVVNTLYSLHQSVSKVLAGSSQYPTEALDSIQDSLQSIVLLMSNAINPLLSSISDALEAIVLTMHQEDFSMLIKIVMPNICQSDFHPHTTRVVPAILRSAPADGQTDAPCSLYMRELRDFVSRCQSDYLSQYQCTEFIMKSIQPIASRCIELFVRHASLVRPLGEGGKLRMAADFAQMEMAISPFCKRVSDLGRPYRLLRACRPLFFQTVEHIMESPALGEIIPYSTLLHFCFARAPPDIKSPHITADWSLSHYSQWLDDHQSEKDRLALIKGSLEAYVQQVKSRHGKEFAPIYPIMLQLLQKGLQHAT